MRSSLGADEDDAIGNLCLSDINSPRLGRRIGLVHGFWNNVRTHEQLLPKVNSEPCKIRWVDLDDCLEGLLSCSPHHQLRLNPHGTLLAGPSSHSRSDAVNVPVQNRRSSSQFFSDTNASGHPISCGRSQRAKKAESAQRTVSIILHPRWVKRLATNFELMVFSGPTSI